MPDHIPPTAPPLPPVRAGTPAVPPWRDVAPAPPEDDWWDRLYAQPDADPHPADSDPDDPDADPDHDEDDDQEQPEPPAPRAARALDWWRKTGPAGPPTPKEPAAPAEQTDGKVITGQVEKVTTEPAPVTRQRAQLDHRTIVLAYNVTAAGAGWALGLLPKFGAAIASCGREYSITAALILGGTICFAAWTLVDRRTRGWWPPLAWVCRIPYATAVAALCLYAPADAAL